jgi:hypothetical protein
VWALRLGLRHGTRGVRGTRQAVGIRGGGLVVCPVMALVKRAMRPMKARLEGRRHMREQRQAVGDLRGVWRALPTACGLGVCAVPGDHRDVGRGWKPRGHGCSRSLCKHINGATPLASDQEGAGALAFPPRPVVAAHACRCRALRQPPAAHTAQEGLATTWETVARPVPRAGSAAADQPRVGWRGGASRGRARIKRRHGRESCGTGLATTRAGTTAAAAHDDTPREGRRRPWSVGQGAPRVPRDARGRLAASGTGGVGREHGRHQEEMGRIADQGLQRDPVIGW